MSRRLGRFLRSFLGQINFQRTAPACRAKQRALTGTGTQGWSLSGLLPLPFGRGEGWGEGTVWLPPNQCAAGDFHDQVAACRTIHTLPQSAFAVGGNQARLIVLADKIVQVVIGLKYNVAAASAVSSARSTFGPVLLPLERHAAFAAVSRPGINFDLVDKHGFSVNKKGEANDLAAKSNSPLPSSTSGYCRFGHRSLGQNIDASAVLVERHFSVHQCEQSPIAASADIAAGHKFRAALTHDNAAGGHRLAAIAFDAQPFADAVPSVTDASLTFFMCHKPLSI